MKFGIFIHTKISVLPSGRQFLLDLNLTFLKMVNQDLLLRSIGELHNVTFVSCMKPPKKKFKVVWVNLVFSPFLQKEAL